MSNHLRGVTGPPQSQEEMKQKRKDGSRGNVKAWRVSAMFLNKTSFINMLEVNTFNFVGKKSTFTQIAVKALSI